MLIKRFLKLSKNINSNNIRKILSSKETKKAFILYSAQIFSILFAFIAQKLNTNFLTKEEFGSVSWIIQYLVFVHPLFECGYFASGAKLLSAETNDEKIRRIYGLLILVLMLFSGLIIIFSYSLLIAFPSIFPDGLVKSGMFVGSLFSCSYVIQYFLQTVVQGSGDVQHLSIFMFFSRLLSVVFLAATVITTKLDQNISLFISLFSICIAGIAVLQRIRPIFVKWSELYPLLRQMNQEYGKHIFIGRLVTAPTMQLAPLLVPYFGGVAGSALYAVGSNLVTPMVQATQSISTSLFKNFAQQRKLKDRLILINFLVLVFIGVLIYTFSPFLIELSANKNYFAALPYMIPLILGGFFQGMWQPFHLFSLARGNGKWIKQQQIVASVIDLISTLILIPYYGVAGAYWQFFISRCIRFFLTLHNYYRTVKNIDSSIL